MSKSISLSVETQSEKKEVISVCHINEETLALESSYIAEKMFRLNRGLFNKINPTTEIVGGAVYRQEVILVKGNRNSLSVPVLDTYDFNEVEIGKLHFADNMLVKQNRAVNKDGRRFDYDPSLVSEDNTGGFFNDKKISFVDCSRSSPSLFKSPKLPSSACRVLNKVFVVVTP